MISTCQTVVEPILQRRVITTHPGIVIPQRVPPSPPASEFRIVTQQTVPTYSCANVNVPVGKTFIVPHGAFGPERDREDGGNLFEMIQKHQNGYISQKAVKQMMAQVEAARPVTSSAAGSALIPCTVGRHVMQGVHTADAQCIASPRLTSPRVVTSPRLVTRSAKNMPTSPLATHRTVSTTSSTPLGSATVPVRPADFLFGPAAAAITPRPVSLDGGLPIRTVYAGSTAKLHEARLNFHSEAKMNEARLNFRNEELINQWRMRGGTK